MSSAELHTIDIDIHSPILRPQLDPCQRAAVTEWELYNISDGVLNTDHLVTNYIYFSGLVVTYFCSALIIVLGGFLFGFTGWAIFHYVHN